MKSNMFRANFYKLISVGVREKQTTYEQGLIKLTNKSALAILLIINLVLLPLALINRQTLPILFINSIFFPVTLLLNYAGKHSLARHFLICLLYLMLLLISVYRGRGSGVSFILIPTILLSMIFFYKKTGFYFHIAIGIITIAIIFFLHYYGTPLSPYPASLSRLVYPFHLVISLALTFFFINFFFTLNTEYQKELMELNFTKNKIISIISHDLRSPLSSLKGILSLLNNRSISQEEFYQLSADLEKNTENLSDMLDNLLQWAFTQMKGFTPNPVNFSLHQIVEEQIGLFSEAARQKGISLHNYIAVHTTAYADVNHIRLILRNLINNAIKFTNDGGSVSVRAVSDNDHITVSVSDTGIGIQEDYLKKMFSSDQPTSAVGTKGESGTGLGLLLCKEMIAYNGGEFWADSKPGVGSSFYFSLPVQNKVNNKSQPAWSGSAKASITKK